MNAAEQRRALQSGQRAKPATEIAGAVSALLAVVIAVMVNYLAFRHYERFDWTEEGLFTLSGKSQRVLEGLQQDVEIYLFMSSSEQNFEETQELLKRYQAASPKLAVKYVDPDREPSEFQLLAQRFGLSTGMMETGETMVDVAAVVSSGDKHWSVKRQDLIDLDLGGLQQGAEQSLDVKAEQALTGAIVQVVSGRPTKVCLSEGHGEWQLDAAERSLQGLKQLLRHDNVEWESVGLLGKDEVPAECDAVFVIGPERAFNEDERALLSSYVRGGGRLLLALDPVIDRDEIRPTGLEDMTAELGVLIDRTLVLELNRERLVSPVPLEFLVTEYGDHETTRGLSLGGGRTFMALARSVRPADEDAGVDVLMQSSTEAFGETSVQQVQGEGEPQKDADDVVGPLSLGVARELPPGDEGGDEGEKARAGRLVVLGDSDWLAQEFVSNPALTNDILATAITGWLTAREALVAIPPKKASLGYVTFSQEGIDSLLWQVVFLLPLASLLLGFAVWLNRRD